MILKVMLDYDDFEDDAGILMSMKVIQDFDDFENDAGF